jgi:hypothetical protein
MVRRCVSFGYRIDDPKERRLWLTLAAAIQFKMLKRWRWTSVLTKVMWIGLFYVIVQVGIGLLVTVFMSWLNDVLQDLPLYATTIIFFLIGVVMFLLPPVPGLPVFLTGGILLGKAGEPVFTFFGAIAYASAVCWVCKMFSLFLQQKAIGQGMSGSLYIRKTVGINSITIRAIRRLLRKPGLSMPKVMILIGGPDWPTSVLTGILRLSWIQMQIGTAPIIFLIIPMVGSGAFLLKTNEGGLWGPMSDVTIAVAALTQIIAILLAMYYISETAEQHYDELAQRARRRGGRRRRARRGRDAGAEARAPVVVRRRLSVVDARAARARRDFDHGLRLCADRRRRAGVRAVLADRQRRRTSSTTICSTWCCRGAGCA